MSHSHDPYRRPEPTPVSQQAHVADEGGGGDDGIASTSGGPGNSDRQPAAQQGEPVAAPISWERGGGPAPEDAWAAPDPFAAPLERPAPPTPVLESDVRPSHDADESWAASPSLAKSAPAIEQEQSAPVAFPDPVPAPVAPPSREPAQQPQQLQQPPQPWAGQSEHQQSEQPQPPQEQIFQQPPPQDQPPSEPADDDEEALTIGRGKANSIVLDDMLVSRHHVRITADDDGLVLQDLGSRNGTYVNGLRVERVSLHEGDRLGIGATTFEVRDGWLVSV